MYTFRWWVRHSANRTQYENDLRIYQEPSYAVRGMKLKTGPTSVHQVGVHVMRDVVDRGLNLVQPRLNRRIYSAYTAPTSAELTKNID